jgi:uncharacterized protein (TIGR00369 family)
MQADALRALLDAPREYGLVPPKTAVEMSGRDLLQAMIDGRLPAPPIMKLVRFALTEVAPGRALFEGLSSFDYYNPLGSVHGGIIATLLDSAMGCAVHSTLAAGQGYTTLEFKLSFIRAVTKDTGVLRAEGRVLNVGRRAGTAEAHLTDAGGRLLAHATTTCLVFDLPKAGA